MLALLPNNEAGFGVPIMYLGGTQAYRKKVDEVAANGYDGFVLE